MRHERDIDCAPATLNEQVRTRLDIWLRSLDRYLEAVAESGDPRAAEVESLARKMKKPATAQWLRDTTSPAHVRAVVRRVRHYLRIGDIGKASETHERFETTRRHVEALLDRPLKATGETIRDAHKKRPTKDVRNEAMAREYLRRREKAPKAVSCSAIKASIGTAHGLQRRGAIDAVNAGLKRIRAGIG